ncbi:hypothetical protein ABFB50_02985 [Dehalococcoides sp. THU3]|uniref:SHOCT-like domain-containing protein n=1 Tax=Dehalococcoides TaxID=61434 RepID=UPI0005B57174|nr:MULTISPECIES: hypothetical protein [Dehalococcoides]QYY58198.1 hypothetical protein CWV2_000055 [Dehalococcoides mccartyi]BAQ34469.1 hypothetical protein UCH007_05110 [Dehalococcoides sp. UCH007]
MSENAKKILQMLSEGKITVDQANKLLEALGNEDPKPAPAAAITAKGVPKYLRVIINGTDEDSNAKVNVRVPMALLRAGIKLASILPADATNEIDSNLKEKGVNFDFKNLREEDIEPLIEAMTEMEVDVDSEGSKVKVFTE